MRILLALLFILPTYLFAQNLHITVLDVETKEPLPFANIYGKKSGVGTSTNIDGVATFNQAKLRATDSLIVSYIGYKEQVYYFEKTSTAQNVSIAMEADGQILEEVVVKYEKPIKPVKIIKAAIKNVEQNYSTEDVIYNSLYRETIQEGDDFIQLNEGIVQTYYTGYPQKKLDRKIWEDWYYDNTYAFDAEGYSIGSQLLKDFNTKRDQQRIIASRSSEDWSRLGLNYSIYTDPLLLFAFDKIKYQYDFFNPSLLRKYIFKNESPELINGEACHVVSFYPKTARIKFSSDQRKKNKHPIYIGRAYITKSSFALVKFEYKLAGERIFGFFEKSIPLDYQVSMEYKKKDSLYFIDKIKYRRKNPNRFKIKEGGDLVESVMEIFVTNTQTENVKPFPDSTIFKSTKFSALRYYKKNYNPSYWDNLESKPPYKLNDKLVSDLEKEKPLKDQFEHFNITTKRAMPLPMAYKEHQVYDYHDDKVVDSLAWMADPKHEEKLIKYVVAENKFADNEIIEEKRYQRKFFNKLSGFYVKEKVKDIKRKPGSYYSEADSLDNVNYYYQVDSTTRKKVFDITAFQYAHSDGFITSTKPNAEKDLVMITYNKPGVSGAFVSIQRFGEDISLDYFANVYSIQWATDSDVLYAKEDDIERASSLMYRNVRNQKDSLVYYEEDKNFDVEVAKSGKQLFCTLQSFTENEIHLVKMGESKIDLEMIKKREDGVMSVPYAKDDVHLIVNSDTEGSSIMTSSFDNPKQLNTVSTAPKEDIVLDIIVMKDKMVALFFDNSIPMLKYLENGKKKWKKLKLDLGLGQCDLIKAIDDNSFEFYFESPKNPGASYEYNFVSKKLKKITGTNNLKSQAHKYNESKRIWATGHDGVKIPITITSNRAYRNENAGVILKVYGTYGSIVQPYFSRLESVLLSQGYIIAFAHVRGSACLGTQWHKAGRELQKKNSILDYIACAKHLVKEGIASTSSLVGYGNSAGATIVGQAINLKPHLFNTVILGHPYLDVVNTMMNEKLSGTVSHYSELGNPSDKVVYEYMKEYSPYHNIKPQRYPNVVLVAGYKDQRTPIWQVANYAAKLRERNLSDSKILLMTDMEEGHMSNMGSIKGMKRDAKVYSFLRMTNAALSN